jgi:hypothetical protein
MMHPEPVECHSGTTYGERPTAFRWEGGRLLITKIATQWRTPMGRNFRVQVEDGRVFELSFDESSGEWQIRLL